MARLSSPGDPSDRILWQRAAQGDRDAFGQIFDRHAAAVYNYLFRLSADWSVAEDLTSAVFLQAWRRRRQVSLDRESALPWLLGVANYVMRNSRRSLRRQHAALARIAAEGGPSRDHADDVAARVDTERQMASLRAAVNRLPRQQREVIELCAWSGLDHQAAAITLGVAVGTVKSRLHRARRRLAADISGGHQPGGQATATDRRPASIRERP
jgi:RNA polymerase sigma factor (sigma-70 family)